MQSSDTLDTELYLPSIAIVMLQKELLHPTKLVAYCTEHFNFQVFSNTEQEWNHYTNLCPTDRIVQLDHIDMVSLYSVSLRCIAW